MSGAAAGPTDLGMSQVLPEWGRQFGSLPEAYWRAFREVALDMWIQRTSAANYQYGGPPTAPKQAGGQEMTLGTRTIGFLALSQLAAPAFRPT